MAVQNINKKRGGVATVVTIGKDDTDRNTRYLERTVEPDPIEQQHKRNFLKRLVIEFDDRPNVEGTCESRILSIQTFIGEALENNAGKVIHGTIKYKDMFSRKEDILDFVERYFSILFSVENGKTQGPIQGHAFLPVFYSKNVLAEDGKTVLHYAGQVIQYTEEEENRAPIFRGPGSYNYVAPTVDSPAPSM